MLLMLCLHCATAVFIFPQCGKNKRIILLSFVADFTLPLSGFFTSFDSVYLVYQTVEMTGQKHTVIAI